MANDRGNRRPGDPGARPPNDADLQRFLAARADAAARQSADPDMVEKVAIAVGLVRPRRNSSTAVRLILVGAALALAFAVAMGSGVINPQPTPSPQPTASPSPTPSVRPAPTATTGPTPAALGPAEEIPYPALAVATTASEVWAADATGELAQLDPANGAVLRRVTLPRPASALLVTADSVWVSSEAGDLVRVDRSTLAITPIEGAVGVALALGPDAIWLGADGEVVRIDPATNAVSLRVSVPGRQARRGVAASEGDVWVGTDTEILRLDAGSGTVAGRLPGDASSLLVRAGRLWAVRGTELLQIDVSRFEVVTFTPGIPGSPLGADAEHIWVAGPGGGGPFGSIVGVTVTDPAIDTAGSLPWTVSQLAVGAGGIWITPGDDEPGVLYRVAAP